MGRVKLLSLGLAGLFTSERRRISLLTVGLYLGLVSGFIFAREVLSTGYAPDFTTLWAAARADRSAVYDVHALTRLQASFAPIYNLRPFPYPPTALLPLEPFGTLPLWPAMAAWTAVGFGLFLGVLWRRLRLWEIGLVATAPCVLYAATSGQTSLILGAAIAAAMFALPERPRLAGVALGLVAAVKPQLVLLAPIALLAQPAALAGFFLAGAGAVALSVAAYGASLWMAWFHVLPQFMSIVGSTPLIVERNLSPAAAMIAAGAGPAWLVRAVWALMGALIVALVMRRKAEPETRLAALVLGSFLCSPYVMAYDAAVLAPAAVLMLRRTWSPAILGLAILPYVPWMGAAAMALLALCLLASELALLFPPAGPTWAALRRGMVRPQA